VEGALTAVVARYAGVPASYVSIAIVVGASFASARRLQSASAVFVDYTIRIPVNAVSGISAASVAAGLLAPSAAEVTKALAAKVTEALGSDPWGLRVVSVGTPQVATYTAIATARTTSTLTSTGAAALPSVPPVAAVGGGSDVGTGAVDAGFPMLLVIILGSAGILLLCTFIMLCAFRGKISRRLGPAKPLPAAALRNASWVSAVEKKGDALHLVFEDDRFDVISPGAAASASSAVHLVMEAEEEEGSVSSASSLGNEGAETAMLAFETVQEDGPGSPQTAGVRQRSGGRSLSSAQDEVFEALDALLAHGAAEGRPLCGVRPIVSAPGLKASTAAGGASPLRRWPP